MKCVTSWCAAIERVNNRTLFNALFEKYGVSLCRIRKRMVHLMTSTIAKTFMERGICIENGQLPSNFSFPHADEKRGRKRALTAAEEKIIVHAVLELAERNTPLRNRGVRDLVQHFDNNELSTERRKMFRLRRTPINSMDSSFCSTTSGNI